MLDEREPVGPAQLRYPRPAEPEDQRSLARGDPIGPAGCVPVEGQTFDVLAGQAPALVLDRLGQDTVHDELGDSELRDAEDLAGLGTAEPEDGTRVGFVPLAHRRRVARARGFGASPVTPSGPRVRAVQLVLRDPGATGPGRRRRALAPGPARRP